MPFHFRSALLLACIFVVPAVAHADSAQATNFNPITLPDTTGGPATGTPFPSTITVSGVTGTIDSLNGVSVELKDVTDSNLSELYFELVSPTGIGFEFLGDTGGSITNLSYNFTDSAAVQLNSTDNFSGNFKPNVSGTTCVNLPTLAAPRCAPTQGTYTFGTEFEGIDPNGTWSLYVYDPNTGDAAGCIADGWTLDINTTNGTGGFISSVSGNGGNCSSGSGSGSGSGSNPMPEPGSLLPIGLAALAVLKLRVRFRPASR